MGTPLRWGASTGGSGSTEMTKESTALVEGCGAMGAVASARIARLVRRRAGGQAVRTGAWMRVLKQCIV